MKNIKIDWYSAVVVLFIAALFLMATKWSDYGSLTAGNIADDDTFMVLDVSDTTLGSTGTQKEYSWSAMKTDLSTFDSLEIPNGTNPTVDTMGEIAWDSTTGQLIAYGTAVRVHPWRQRQCFTLEDPTDADDNIPIFSLNNAFTVNRIDCIVKGGTSAVVVLNDGTNNLDSMTCATTMTSDASLSNNTFTSLELMEVDIGTVTGAVDWVNVCFQYSITRN